jgi:hypothetical protein
VLADDIRGSHGLRSSQEKNRCEQYRRLIFRLWPDLLVTAPFIVAVISVVSVKWPSPKTESLAYQNKSVTFDT